MKKWITSFLAMILVALSLQQSHAQSITLGQVTGLVGDTVSVPVVYSGANPLTLSALTLAVNYDSTRLRCLSQITDLNSGITTANLLTNLYKGRGSKIPVQRCRT
ncbi:MAG: cohesin domain-containing protein [Bacteroidota bacterium]